MKHITYIELQGRSTGFYVLFVALTGLLLIGLTSAWRMEHFGHHITGMSNQIVWGMPHVFAVFLIVAASGALNVASIGSVFGQPSYKPLGRLSGLLAIALLVGGLAILVLDLGRPDRLIVAMTHYNFRSIFAWNIFLYVGFIGIVSIYLWVQMEQRMNRYSNAIALLALIWRLILTTGTGLIFGFLVAREAYDTAMMAPLFIAMSFSFGLASFILTLIVICNGTGQKPDDEILKRMMRLLGLFATSVLYFTAVQHLTNIYAAEHTGVERFILLDGGIYPVLFWVGQVIMGGLLPIVLVFWPGMTRRIFLAAIASILVILGGLIQLYVILIGGQAYPLELFPGMGVRSSFYDGVVMEYVPSWPEIGLGLGGMALAGLIVLIGLKLFRFLPQHIAESTS